MTPRLKQLLPFIAVGIIIIAIPIGIYLVQRQQELRSRAVNNENQSVDLSLSSNTTQVQTNNTFTVDVNMSPTSGVAVRRDISGVDFYINYPTTTTPRASTGTNCTGTGAVSIANNGFLPSDFSGSQIVNLPQDDAINNRLGTMHFAAFDNAIRPIRGGNPYRIGTITFTAISPGCVTINFGDAIVSAAGQDPAVNITSKSSINLAVVGPSPTITPTLTPTPSVARFIPGDYDRNGCVGTSDYTRWQQQNGRIGTNLTADGTNNGVVDFEDYQFWLDAYNAGNDRCAGN